MILQKTKNHYCRHCFRAVSDNIFFPGFVKEAVRKMFHYHHRFIDRQVIQLEKLIFLFVRTINSCTGRQI